MQHFFIITTLGLDYKMWNDELKSNPFLISHFNQENPRYYLNRNINFEPCPYEKINTRHFDILVHNWQTGFKDALDFSPLIYLKAPYDLSFQRIRNLNLIHKKHIEDYLELRLIKIKQILARNPLNITIDVTKDMYMNLQAIADFLRVPFYFNQGKDRQ
jgi:hypothetical protein